MKLFLSSYHLGDNPPEILRLITGNKRVAIIANAIDSLDKEERTKRVDTEIEDMKSLGLEPTEVDLRDYFGQTEALGKALLQYGMVWIRGGNVFILRKAMALSGFDEILIQLLEKDIVYAGYSAAACIAGPTLRGIELCDDVKLVPEGYPDEIRWDGLGLIDFSIAPHYKSEHYESSRIDNVVEYFENNNMKYKTLRDGEVLIIET